MSRSKCSPKGRQKLGLVQGLVDLSAELGFYSNHNRKQLRDLKEGSGMDVIYIFKRSLTSMRKVGKRTSYELTTIVCGEII